MVGKLHEKSNTKGVKMYIVTGEKKNNKFSYLKRKLIKKILKFLLIFRF